VSLTGCRPQPARSGTAAHVEKLVRACRRVDRLADEELEQERHASRSLQASFDEDGMLVLRALEAASDALFESGEEKAAIPVTQRRADGLQFMAESAHELDVAPAQPRPWALPTVLSS